MHFLVIKHQYTLHLHSYVCVLLAHYCYVCGKAGKWICSQCNGSNFCNECKHLWHKHPGRENHHPVINQESADVEVGKLQLLSVLCIETSHYVCFTRIMGSGKTDCQWVFFDSMAERPGNNILYSIQRNIEGGKLSQFS